VKLEAARAARGNVIWIEEMLPKPDVIQILSHATVFACPSVYEPMGIVNLEAMACEAAVVATAVGGIPEVVEDGVTGLLVPYEAVADGTGTPVDPAGLAAGLAARVNELLADPARARAMGAAAVELRLGPPPGRSRCTSGCWLSHRGPSILTHLHYLLWDLVRPAVSGYSQCQLGQAVLGRPQPSLVAQAPGTEDRITVSGARRMSRMRNSRRACSKAYAPASRGR
jgi:hypothetical protein